MRKLIPSGDLRTMLLPPTYGQHVTRSTEFTVLSVEIWATGLVVNIHLASDGGPEPRIILEDHFGTEYSFQDSATLGSRNLQVFSPSVPPGTRSLTIRSADGPEPRLILQDHFGTEYSFRDSATLESRNLQAFTPSVPPGTRSLTIRSADDPEGRPVVTFAVPLMAVPEEPEAPRNGEYPPSPELRRPA